VGFESCTVKFLARHFLFTSSETSAVGCIDQPQNTPKTNRRQFGKWAPPTRAETKLALLQRYRTDTASNRRFGSAAIPYVVRSTIGLLSDSYASCSLTLFGCHHVSQTSQVKSSSLKYMTMANAQPYNKKYRLTFSEVIIFKNVNVYYIGLNIL